MEDGGTDTTDGRVIRARAREVLDGAWDDARGYCYPNRDVYPHLWLWDSCFHAICWAALDDERAVTELEAVFAGQLPDGFVPHMRYAGPPPTDLGPLSGVSSITQPPVYAHAAKVLAEHGMAPGAPVVDGVAAGLGQLWRDRRIGLDLLYLVHPWEGGNDHSPRWDDWVRPGYGPADYHQRARSALNAGWVASLRYTPRGVANWSTSFVVAPAGFNAIAAHAAAELADLTGDGVWAERSAALADAMDHHLWDDHQGQWVDLPLVGGGGSCRIPTADGLLGVLVTRDEGKARRALAQLADGERFAAPFGVRYIAADHPSYHPGQYWRGPAWPQLQYLLWVACRRWGADDLAREVARRGVSGAETSGWAEYWNPETGQGLGARPQTWAALAAVFC